jgi:hypothetical protein
MSVTYDQVRQFALTLPGVLEGRAYGGPSLHVGRKFMGRLREDGETLVLKIDPARRARLMKRGPTPFFSPSIIGRTPYVLIDLLAVNPSTLRKLIEEAWRMVAPKRMISAYDTSARKQKA